MCVYACVSVYIYIYKTENIHEKWQLIDLVVWFVQKKSWTTSFANKIWTADLFENWSKSQATNLNFSLQSHLFHWLTNLVQVLISSAFTMPPLKTICDESENMKVTAKLHIVITIMFYCQAAESFVLLVEVLSNLDQVLISSAVTMPALKTIYNESANMKITTELHIAWFWLAICKL